MNVKIAALTRGYSYESDYEWNASWLDSKSSIADRECRAEIRRYGLENLIRSSEPGVCIGRQLHQFAVLVTGIPTDFRAARPGLITITYAFFGMDENAARKLTSAILLDWNNWIRNSGYFIVRDNLPTHSDPEWSIDAGGMKDFCQKAIDGSNAPMVLISSRRSRPYPDGDFSAGSSDLGLLMQSQQFSSSDGMKAAIGKPYSGEAEIYIRDDADMFAIPGTEVSDALPRSKKKMLPVPIRSNKSKEPSKTLSDGTFPSTYRPSSSSACWIFSNKGLVTICGVVAIGILLGATCKKKAHESPVLKPASPGTVTLDGKKSEGDKDVPKATSEKKDSPQNLDGNAPTEATDDNTSLRNPVPAKP